MSSYPTADTTVHVSVRSLLHLIASCKKFDLKHRKLGHIKQGDYLSRFKGRGMEFDESRPYQPGDDVRYLDWHVTARTGKPYSKVFCEEQERPVFFCVDQRQCMRFATRGKFKSVVAAELASLLAWSAAEHDRVGSIVFSDHSHHETKPKRGRSAVLHLMNQLATYSQSTEDGVREAPSIRNVVQRLRYLVKPGSLVFLLSDFRHFDDVAESQLRQLAQHNDVALVLIYDALEEKLPPAGQYQIIHDKKRILLSTHNRQVVKDYQERFVAHKKRLQDLAHLFRTPFLLCQTTDDPIAILQYQLI